jgi:hypothetical protein
MALLERIRSAQAAQSNQRTEDWLVASDNEYARWTAEHTCTWCGRRANDVRNGWCPAPRANDVRHGDLWD